MLLTLDRRYKKQDYTIGVLYVNGKFFCNTIEDTDRGLSDSDSIEQILKKKVYAKTAIPTGKYKIPMNTVSPKFSRKEYYRKFCSGRLTRILNVKGFDGILIHRGVNASSTAGCIIVGRNTVKGAVTDSQECFEGLYKLLDEANKQGEIIEIEITGG